jgi:hypothetical protein
MRSHSLREKQFSWLNGIPAWPNRRGRRVQLIDGNNGAYLLAVRARDVRVVKPAALPSRWKHLASIAFRFAGRAPL